MTETQEAQINPLEKDIRELINKARQLAEVARDWNLDEVEINGEMVTITSLIKEFTL